MKHRTGGTLGRMGCQLPDPLQERPCKQCSCVCWRVGRGYVTLGRAKTLLCQAHACMHGYETLSDCHQSCVHCGSGHNAVQYNSVAKYQGYCTRNGGMGGGGGGGGARRDGDGCLWFCYWCVCVCVCARARACVSVRVCVYWEMGGGGGGTSFYIFTLLCEKGITKLILPLNNFTVVVVAMVVVGGR